MKTEIIAGSKPVNTAKGARVIVITASGKQVWVLPDQFQSDAEVISYEERKKGDKITLLKDSGDKKKGDVIELQADRNDLVAFGKQIVQKFNTLQVMDHLIKAGVAPAFNM